MKKIVIAYSGGLDTSYCAKTLSENANHEVHAVSVNTGGFSEEEHKIMEAKAYQMGVKTFKSINAISIFYDNVVKYLIYANVLKNNTYPLSVSAERIIQAIEIVKYAKSINADAIAHGSTGAGNDQVRFDMIFQILSPGIEIITPIRDQKLTREEEIDYLKKNGIDISWEKAQYSINQGLWGTSVGGKETLTSNLPLPDEAYPSQLEKTDPEQIKLTFDKGELVAINGEKDSPENNIQNLNAMASLFAIGRDIHVGDTIIGIKGRVGFEAAAPLIIIKAHHLLEKHVLTKAQQMHKHYLAQWYGDMLHDGHYLDEVMRNMETFFTATQKNVTGDVFVTLHPYRFTLDGISSVHDLMATKTAAYGETNTGWTATEIKGFIKLLANQNTIYNQINSN